MLLILIFLSFYASAMQQERVNQSQALDLHMNVNNEISKLLQTSNKFQDPHANALNEVQAGVLMGAVSEHIQIAVVKRGDLESPIIDSSVVQDHDSSVVQDCVKQNDREAIQGQSSSQESIISQQQEFVEKIDDFFESIVNEDSDFRLESQTPTSPIFLSQGRLRIILPRYDSPA